MKLGYGLITCQRYPGDPRSAADLYRQAIENCQLAEKVGLDSVWTSEHHFWDDDYMPSLLVLSAAIAAKTERISVGTGVLLAPLYHPIRLAEDAATVDLISGGRLILGLGIGWRQEEFDRLGIPMQKLGPRLSETVRILKKAWREGTFTHQGKIFDFPATNVTPKPAGQIPIVLGGFVDPAIRRAGRIADGYIGSSTRREGGSAVEEVARKMHIAKQALLEKGRNPSDFIFSFHEPVWVTDDPANAEDEILPHIHYSRWKYRDMGAEFGRGGGPLPEPPPLDDETKARLRDAVIIGTAEQVAERLKQFQSAVGEDIHVIARSDYPGVPADKTSRCIELLGKVREILTT